MELSDTQVDALQNKGFGGIKGCPLSMPLKMSG